MCRCNGGVNFTMQRDSSKALRYAALQSEAGKKLLQRCGRKPNDISSIVFVEPDACFIKSEAVLRIAQKLNQPFPALASSLLPLPGLIRDAVYDQVDFSSVPGHLQALRPNDVTTFKRDLARNIRGGLFVISDTLQLSDLIKPDLTNRISSMMMASDKRKLGLMIWSLLFIIRELCMHL